MKKQKILIMGAAGRDFHNFNTVYRNSPDHEVKAFTAAQIPYIERRKYPAGLAGPLYPEGIAVYPEEQLPSLISQHRIDQVVFAYSDVSHDTVMHKASLCLSLGADFVFLGPEKTMLESRLPVISVCAVRTGCGKSGVTRYVARILKEKGKRTVVIRHPMPYCDLDSGAAMRFAQIEDLDRSNCTIEEREEYEPLVNAGFVVYSGVDYDEVLKNAEKESEVIVWDGGNNDLPFIRPGMEIVVFDPHRAGHELLYYPGETNLRRADVAVINKVDTAAPEKIRRVEENIRMVNPDAIIVHTASRIHADAPELIKGKKVLVIEDGPTLTHGGMPYGAGFLAAKRFGAAEIIDPRPYAKGSIQNTFDRYPHLDRVLPAVGYAAEQMADLRETIESAPCDLVMIATPTNLGGLLSLDKEVVRITYEIEEAGGMELKGCVEGFADCSCTRHFPCA